MSGSKDKYYADAPKEINEMIETIQPLQATIEQLESDIDVLEKGLSKHEPDARLRVENVIRGSRKTIKILEKNLLSYGNALNFEKDLPELKHLPVTFVQTLILAKDLKKKIREKVISCRFEWDQLDRAVAGADQPLGTFVRCHYNVILTS